MTSTGVRTAWVLTQSCLNQVQLFYTFGSLFAVNKQMTSAGFVSVYHQFFLDGQQDRVLKIENGWMGSFGQIIIFLQPFSHLQSNELHCFFL